MLTKLFIKMVIISNNQLGERKTSHKYSLKINQMEILGRLILITF